MSAAEVIVEKEEEEEEEEPSAPVFVTKLAGLQVNVGDVSRMDVCVESSVPPTITWLFNDQPIKQLIGNRACLSETFCGKGLKCSPLDLDG